MAFGVTGSYVAEGKPQSFDFPIESAQASIANLPNGQVELIRIYAHGMPGQIYEWRASDLESMLKCKMKKFGQIHLLGCSTAGVDAHAWNPMGGIGLICRAVMYGSISAPSVAAGPRLRNRTLPKRMDGPPSVPSFEWDDNLAYNVSMKIPNVWVVGLGGISFPLSRVACKFEGHQPRLLMGDRQAYLNGHRSKPPGGNCQW